MNTEKVFNLDPVSQAKSFASQGCQWLHIVDLNGAFLGRSVNAESIKSILNVIDIPIQIGGGVRSLDTIEYWLARGARRIVLGTVALKEPNLVLEACRLFPGSIAVGIDVKSGMVAVEGWAEVSEITALNLGRKFEDSGVATIVYTNISRDGTMLGPDIESTLSLASKISVPIILSGGISSLEDLTVALKKSKASKTPLEGIISGRAVYEGKLSISEATRLCGQY